MGRHFAAMRSVGSRSEVYSDSHAVRVSGGRHVFIRGQYLPEHGEGLRRAHAGERGEAAAQLVADASRGAVAPGRGERAVGEQAVLDVIGTVVQLARAAHYLVRPGPKLDVH